jgi:UDP-glucose 4-epimerase
LKSEECRYGRVLVVGGAGFVGGNLVTTLADLGASEILVIDNLLSSERFNVPERPNVSFVEGSITDDDVLDSIEDRFDYVFNLATFHGNQNSIADPLADHANNTLTTLRLLETLKHFRNLKAFVYSSAGCVVAPKTFDSANATREDALVSLFLDSPYQISKVVGEMYCNYYRSRYGVPTVVARFQNVYGPREFLGAGRWRGTAATVWRNVVPSFVYRALRSLPLTLENSGIATRDFIYVDDIVRGLLLCAVAGKHGEVYNLASGSETSISDLASTILRLSGSPAEITSAPARSWDRSGKRFGSVEKSSECLGFRAEVGIEEGLERTIHWTRGSLGLIEACIQKHEARVRAA